MPSVAHTDPRESSSDSSIIPAPLVPDTEAAISHRCAVPLPSSPCSASAARMAVSRRVVTVAAGGRSERASRGRSGATPSVVSWLQGETLNEDLIQRARHTTGSPPTLHTGTRDAVGRAGAQRVARDPSMVASRTFGCMVVIEAAFRSSVARRAIARPVAPEPW